MVNPNVLVTYNKEFSHPCNLVGRLVWEWELIGQTNYNRGTQMKYENLSMYKGEDKSIHIYIKDQDLNPIIMTGSMSTFVVKKSKSDATNLIEKHTNVNGEGMIGAPEQGEIYFNLMPSDTNNLEPRQYVWHVKTVTASAKTFIVFEGTLTIELP